MFNDIIKISIIPIIPIIVGFFFLYRMKNDVILMEKYNRGRFAKVFYKILGYGSLVIAALMILGNIDKALK